MQAYSTKREREKQRERRRERKKTEKKEAKKQERKKENANTLKSKKNDRERRENLEVGMVNSNGADMQMIPLRSPCVDPGIEENMEGLVVKVELFIKHGTVE